MKRFSMSTNNIAQLTKQQQTVVDSNDTTVLVNAVAGSGKTLLAVQVALDQFFKRQYNKLIITRPTISTEDNGFLPGCPHQSYMRDGHEQATIHAEQNAIADAARRGVSIDKSTIYITHRPCINCTKFIISSGIKHIKYLKDYRNDDLVEQLLKTSNISLQKV